jgi:hypothetical protein
VRDAGPVVPLDPMGVGAVQRWGIAVTRGNLEARARHAGLGSVWPMTAVSVALFLPVLLTIGGGGSSPEVTDRVLASMAVGVLGAMVGFPWFLARGAARWVTIGVGLAGALAVAAASWATTGPLLLDVRNVTWLAWGLATSLGVGWLSRAWTERRAPVDGGPERIPAAELIARYSGAEAEPLGRRITFWDRWRAAQYLVGIGTWFVASAVDGLAGEALTRTAWARGLLGAGSLAFLAMMVTSQASWWVRIGLVAIAWLLLKDGLPPTAAELGWGVAAAAVSGAIASGFTRRASRRA